MLKKRPNLFWVVVLIIIVILLGIKFGKDINNDIYTQIDMHLQWLFGSEHIFVDISLSDNSLILSGLFLGSLGTLSLLSLFVFFRLKEMQYIYFTIVLFLILIYETVISGVFFIFNPDLSKFLLSNSIILLDGIIISTFLFTRYYLRTKEIVPRLYNISNIFILFILASLLLWILDYKFIAETATLIWILFTIILLLTKSLIIIKKERKLALSYLVALVIGIIGMELDIMVHYNVISLDLPIDWSFCLINLAIMSISFTLVNRLVTIHKMNLNCKQIEESLTELSLTDELSKLYNKRYLNEKLKQEVKKAHQSGKPLSLGLIDIDHFKKYNDIYGHQEGDKVIARLGELIKENVRVTDYPCRFGGEEFAIILTDTNKFAAEKYVAERLHNSLSKQVFAVSRTEKIFLTVSIGISQLQAEEDVEILIKHADKALYKAKELGRNRTVLYHNNL